MVQKSMETPVKPVYRVGRTKLSGQYKQNSTEGWFRLRIER